MIKKIMSQLYSNKEVTDDIVNELIQKWKKSKEPLRNEFLGGESRIFKEVTYTMSEDEFSRKMKYLFFDLRAFEEVQLDAKRKAEEFTEKLIELNVDKEEFGIFINNNKIPHMGNIKITKYMKSWILEKKVDYEDFLKLYSMIIQDAYLKENLYISTKPEDIITMSYNTNNWRSCMAPDSNYPYKLGLMEYLDSPNLMVAYLKSNIDLENGVHNKKWRALIEITDKKDNYKIFIKRHYPNEISSFNQDILEMLGAELLEEYPNYYKPFSYQFAYQDNSYAIGNKEKKDDSLALGEKESYECPICGATDYCYCGDFGERCIFCENIVTEDDSYYTPEGDIICQSCFENNYIYCDECDQPCANEDATEVSHETPYTMYICPSCLQNDYELCEICGEYVLKTNTNQINEKIVCDDCTDKYYELCDSCYNYILKEEAVYLDSGVFCEECSKKE